MHTPPDDATVHKVTGFVTRGRRELRELLVFRHPSAGIQLPAGTVEPGEAIEVAVVREVQEETGLSRVTLLRHLGSHAESWRPDGRTITRSTPVYSQPRETASTLSIPLAVDLCVAQVGRGWGCRLLQHEGRDVGEAGYI